MTHFLSRLFLGKPLSPEQVAEHLQLVVDTTRPTLGGVGLDDPPQLVRECFGPPTGLADTWRGVHAYPALGFIFYLQERAKKRLSMFVVYARDTVGYPSISGYRGRWMPFGSRDAPTEAQLVEILGDPSHRELDPEDQILELEWETDLLHVGADYDTDGQLVEIAFSFV